MSTLLPEPIKRTQLLYKVIQDIRVWISQNNHNPLYTTAELEKHLDELIYLNEAESVKLNTGQDYMVAPDLINLNTELFMKINFSCYMTCTLLYVGGS